MGNNQYAPPPPLLGVLPCPTLSAVIGATLVFGLLGSVAWSITLAATGLMYGVGGVFVLGVQLDYALLAGVLVLVGALRFLPTRGARYRRVRRVLGWAHRTVAKLPVNGTSNTSS